MWLIMSLTEFAIIGVFHGRDSCYEALSILESTYPDYFNKSRLVAHYVHLDEFNHYLSPIIMAYLDEHNIVLS